MGRGMNLEAIPMNTICGEAVAAVNAILKQHGIERPAVVINIAWKEPANGQTYAIGTAVPKRHRRMMADSLAASVEEAT